MLKEKLATFRDEPRAWATRMLDALMRPGLDLSSKDKIYVAQQRRLLATDERRIPGPHAADRMWRIAARCGLVEKSRHATALRSAHRTEVAKAREVAVPPAHALGAPIRRPPPLRRPVVALGGGSSETWDPAGSPGL